MLAKYTIRDYPDVKQVIKIDEISNLIPNDGFLIIQVDVENDDELFEYVEQFGVFAEMHGINIVVTNKDISVSEVAYKVNKLKEEAEDEQE